jgi:hypothetical protein
MASTLKVGDAWRAQVRRKGHKSISETFSTKAQAVAWARKIEAEMNARRFNDTRGLSNLTLKDLIDWYFEEIGAVHPFGKSKTAVLRTWQRNHGQVILVDITHALLELRGLGDIVASRQLVKANRQLAVAPPSAIGEVLFKAALLAR